MSSATTLADRLAAVGGVEQADMGAGPTVCCLPSCGATLITIAEGIEGGVKLTYSCPVHGTRGTQHLRARGGGSTVVPGHLYAADGADPDIDF